MEKQAEPPTIPIPNMASASSNQFLKSTGVRKFSAVAMIVLFGTTAIPFSPIAGLTFESEGLLLFLDSILVGALFFSPIYFQWQVAVQTCPVAITLPTNIRTMILNGNLIQKRDVIYILEICDDRRSGIGGRGSGGGMRRRR